MQKRLMDAAKFIESQSPVKPKLGVILGSGLGAFADKIKNAVSIPFNEIPHFLAPTVEGHAGRLVIGTLPNSHNLNGPSLPIVVMQGRLHMYEGHSMEQVVFPTRTLCMLGIDTLVLTNSCGGINPSFREGDIMMITDHINLAGENPLKGPNPKGLGPRFPDLSEAYNRDCQKTLRKSAEKMGLELREGVYVWVSGPTYETPAEVRMLRTMGADAVGMSTVPESIAANHFGVRVVGLSCITNLAAGITQNKLTHEEVIANANKTTDVLLQLLEDALPNLPHSKGIAAK